MPELPEVETIKHDLTAKIVGKKIKAVELLNAKIIKEPTPKKFVERLKGQKVQEIIRRAKVLIFKFADDKYLVVHLRLTGWFHCGPVNPKARVIFYFTDGSCLNYMDARLLGQLKLRKSWQDLPFIQNLGKEPFELKLKEFKALFKNKTAKIKPLLLDQTFIAGIGNIYAQEALFSAGIDPRRKANWLKEKELERLYPAILKVLKEGIKYRGSSIDDYRDTQGETGGMEKRLKVYGKKNQPCPNCKRPLKKIQLAGRGTCFCSYCQH